MESNPHRNQVKGKIGDKEFILSATFEHVQNMESSLGRSFLKITQEFASPNSNLFTFAEVASMIFISQENEPKVSYKKIGDMLLQFGMKPGLDMLGEFMKISIQGSEASELGNDPAKASL